MDAAVHIAAHAKIFLTDAVLEKIPGSDDLKDYALKMKQVMTPEFSKKTVNIKLIWDWKGEFPSFPRKYQNKTPYIQEHIPGQAHTLEYSKDELSKMKAPSEPDVSNGVGNMDDDLPF